MQSEEPHATQISEEARSAWVSSFINQFLKGDYDTFPDVDDGKEWFFKNGKFERATAPVDFEKDIDTVAQAAGYERICTFGMEFGFGLQISQHDNNYIVVIDYGNSCQIVCIDSFVDYMEFLRQFGHLGTLAETSATRYYVEHAHELALDDQSGILRDEVREVAKTRKAVEDRNAARLKQRQQPA